MSNSNQNSVLLSIKPIYADLILSGQKTIEVRRTIWKNQNIDKVFLYSSAPVQKVVGEFTIKQIQLKHTILMNNNSFNILSEYAKINIDKLNDYLETSHLFYLIYINEYIKYPEPKPLSHFGIKNPPQNFCYIPSKTQNFCPICKSL